MSYKPFKMKGHTLPGINQRKADRTADGRPGSSALQMKTDAELAAADKAKLNRGARQQDGKGTTDKEKASAMKRAGYYEYDVDGNKKQISTSDYNKKKNSSVGKIATAGVADAKGTPGTIVADQGHGKAIIDKNSSEAKNSPEHKEAVKVGTTPRGQKGTHKKTTRYKKDAKNQAEFDKKQSGDKKSPTKKLDDKNKKHREIKKVPKKEIKGVDRHSKVSGLLLESNGKKVRQSMKIAGRTFVNKQNNDERTRDYIAKNQPKAVVPKDMPKGKKKETIKQFEKKAMRK